MKNIYSLLEYKIQLVGAINIQLIIVNRIF